MEERLTNNFDRAESQLSLLRDCSYMDASVFQRLRATAEISQEWVEQMLDVLIQLDDDLLAFDATIKQEIASLRLPEVRSSQDPGDGSSGLEEAADPMEQSVQRLRNGVRDAMMSMQLQDVIGQAIERAASALEQRAAAIARVVERLGSTQLRTNEIVEIHRLYRTDDDQHRAPGAITEDPNDEEFYKKAA